MAKTTKKKKPKPRKGPAPKFEPVDYWICNGCAGDRGGNLPDDYVGTVSAGTCTYCNGKNQPPGDPIIPWVDFIWPGRAAPVWD